MTVDEQYMLQAIELAQKGLNTTTPNPRVGCVLVRDGAVVGEGWHERAGEPHAEVNALTAAGDRAEGATAYVTLEPCSHFGKTPPCAQALVKAKVARVVYAMTDPNPQVAGTGLQTLGDAGIEVEGPVLEQQAKALNPGFIKRMQTGLPWVRVKLGVSLDGRTAMASGESQWITSGHSRQDVQKWRARSCAIVTGVATVIDDDPALNVRDPDLGANPRQPLRVVLDSRLRTPDDAQILVGGETVIATCAFARPGRYLVPVWPMPSDGGAIQLQALLKKLGDEQCNEVLVEAGPTLAGAFLQANLVDELVVYMAPKMLGSDGRPMAQMPIAALSDAKQFQFKSVTTIGPDIRLILEPKA